MRKFGFGFLFLFAAVGLIEAVILVYDVARSPRTFAPPFSFLILEIHGSLPPAPLRARIYLDTANPDDIRFVGSRLIHHEEKVEDRQAAVPFNGFVVTGTGQVNFGKSIIDIKEDDIAINGRSIHPIEFTVSSSGAFREGYISIAR